MFKVHYICPGGKQVQFLPLTTLLYITPPVQTLPTMPKPTLHCLTLHFPPILPYPTYRSVALKWQCFVYIFLCQQYLHNPYSAFT